MKRVTTEQRLPRAVLYALIAAVALALPLLEWLTGGTGLVKRWAETPVVVGLVGFLVVHVRDASIRAEQRAEQRHSEDRAAAERRHEAERTALAQQLEHAFAVGSSSHMANVAFDRHVAFCEAYCEEVRATLATLDAQGPTDGVRRHAARLCQIRETQALWLTQEIDERLELLEQNLRSLGAGKGRLDTDKEIPAAEREEIVNRVFAIYRRFLGVPPGHGAPADANDGIGARNIVRGLSKLLGVADLTALRAKILQNAVGGAPRT